MRLTAVALLGILVAACSAAPAPAATPTSNTQVAVPVTVRQLIDGSERFSAQRVSLTGQIKVECPEGCWFFLDDGTGMIYIDLKPAELTIPQKIGSRVTLTGKIKGSGGNLQILGDQVKFLDEK
jgi:hypothetical protein